MKKKKSFKSFLVTSPKVKHNLRKRVMLTDKE